MNRASMPPGAVADLLDEKGVVILDGGLATTLESDGADLDDPLWSTIVLLEEPLRVSVAHRAFVEAGADIIATATYQATFRLVLANNVPEGLSGIGGSPGESVYVKVGATTVEPEIQEDAAGWLRLNIDKGNQAQEGEDMINIGNLANPNVRPATAGANERMEQHSLGRDFEVTADDDGALWFIVGTDSGFEGLTTLYYDAITVVLEPE